MSIAQDDFPKNFFKDILQKHFQNDVDILGSKVSYVVPPGENYTCELLRIVVKFSQSNKNSVRSLSLIVKRLVQNELVLQFNKEMGLFSCEFGIYSKILPMMEKLAPKKKVASKTYYASTDLEQMIVIEDLSALNYKMANRQEGLNLEHCLFAIEKLAYFHASSLVLYEKNPKIMDQFNKGMLSKSPTFDSFFTIAFEGTLNACKRTPSLQKYYKKISEIVREKLYTSTQRDPKFNVLNHGDFWCNNLMFQYDADGAVKDVLFVDFQVSVFTSPFYDLHYFIATSTNLMVKEKHINDILHHYYDALVKNVKILEVKTCVPDWKDFQKEFCNKAYIGFASMCVGLPLIKASKRSDASVVNLLENGEEGSFRHHCFTNSNYISAIESLLPIYDSFGVFNS
ncbi:hypothetical protein RN001_013750 [Aquatica leii]|uniref:CHK kinase-like domain-containing protein n=1 Tax=Aquatica leii TaxID=1421715 RepID=A0AAN7NWN5_9COLE|nr:hypothetical protein RN001_013750 [Aquatica leii]